MIKLTDAQNKCLNIMIANSEVHPYEALGYIRNPQIRERVVNSLVNNGWLIYDDNTDNYLLTNQARDHYGLELQREEDTVESEKDETAEPEVGEDVSPNEENSVAWVKNAKINKKRTLIEMLEKETTIEDLIKMTGWKRASVRGVMSTIQKETGRLILKHEKDGVTIYGIESAIDHNEIEEETDGSEVND